MNTSVNYGKRKAESDAGPDAAKRHKEQHAAGVPEKESGVDAQPHPENKELQTDATVMALKAELKKQQEETKQVKDQLDDAKQTIVNSYLRYDTAVKQHEHHVRQLSETISGYANTLSQAAKKEAEQWAHERERDEERDQEMKRLRELITRGDSDLNEVLCMLFPGKEPENVVLDRVLGIIKALKIRTEARDGDFLVLEIPTATRQQTQERCWFAKRLSVNADSKEINIEYFMEHRDAPGTYVFWGGDNTCDFHNVLLSLERLPQNLQERNDLFTMLELVYPNKVFRGAVGPTRAV